MEEARRSGRQRRSNPKYAQDQLEDLEELTEPANAQENSDASSFEQSDADEEEESDDEIDSDASVDAEPQMPDGYDHDDDIEIGPAMDVDGQTFSKINLDEILVGDDLVIDDEDDQALRQSLIWQASGKRTNITRMAKYREGGPRCRGILLHTSVMSKEITLGEIAGFDKYFIDKLRTERHKWSGTITLPHRKDQGNGRSTPDYPEFQDEEVRMNEKQSFVKWYITNGGSVLMERAQATSLVAEGDRNKYMVASRPAQTVLLGPFDQQTKFILEYLNSLSLSEAWNVSPDSPNSSKRNATSRLGWIMNLGSRIITMAWAPSQSGDCQYLAVSVESELPIHVTRVTAMEPSQPYEASLQIWAFASRRENKSILLDTETKPKLVHVICANWGSFRRLAWCPAGGGVDGNDKSIGQLAIITHDGYIRVLDVSRDMEANNPYVKYENVAFASRPPDTNCTCLMWVSANQLAAGCGNGYVAIWNIEQCLAQTKTDFELTGQVSLNAGPYWYHALHTSHIISIIAQQPYPCQYISTNGVDGQIRLTSIRNPVMDKVLGNRERHIMAPLAYSPHILGHYEIDELDGIRARPMRHFPVSRTVGRAPAQVICLEAGGAHPTLLFGCADGSAIVTNPLRRLFIRRIIDVRLEAWQQTWFRHEFVPSMKSPIVNSNDAHQNLTHRENYIFPRPGVSRFLDSHKLEIVSLQRHVQKTLDQESEYDERGSDINDDARPVEKKKENKKKRKKKLAKKVITKQMELKKEDEEIHISIHEEESAVTCVCWNPNIDTGGWAAAGMANGLLRVEDLAL